MTEPPTYQQHAEVPDAAEPLPADRSRASDAPPSRATREKSQEKDRTLRRIHSELSEMAAKQNLGRKGLRRLEQIVNGAASHVSKDPEYRRLYERALQIQAKAMAPPRGSKRRGGPAGVVQSPGLSRGGREVLGGLPSSRRGH